MSPPAHALDKIFQVQMVLKRVRGRWAVPGPTPAWRPSP